MRLITSPDQFAESETETYDRPSRRRTLRLRRNPVQQLSFRERKPNDKVLPDLDLSTGITRKGEDRCGVIGLPAGPCRGAHVPGSAYCFYHDKLQKGLTEPTAQTYPVWPLPLNGYVLLEESGQMWVA